MKKYIGILLLILLISACDNETFNKIVDKVTNTNTATDAKDTDAKGAAKNPKILRVDGTIEEGAFAGRGLIEVIFNNNNLRKIGDRAFDDNLLTKIEIPFGVEIGKEAFANNKLISIIFNPGISGLKIGGGAFANNKLTDITLTNVRWFLNEHVIGDGAFKGNPLERVKLSHALYTEISGRDEGLSGVFGNSDIVYTDQHGNILEPSSPDIIIIPTTKMEIKEEEYFHKFLSGVVFHKPSLISVIPERAFKFNGITSVTIPDSVTHIGVEAFAKNSLINIDFGNSVTSIGDYAFAYNDLTSVTIPSSVTSIGEWAFSYNELESVTIPDSVTHIGHGAFYGNQLTSVAMSVELYLSLSKEGRRWRNRTREEQLLQRFKAVFGNDIKYVDYEGNPFTRTKLTGTVLTIGTIDTTIEQDAYHNKGITKIIFDLPSRVTHIGMHAFVHNKLESVTIPDSVKSIGNGAFADNELTSVTIPSSVTSIGEWAFGANQLTSVTIPDSVVSIGDDAFYGNPITSLIIGDNVRNIGDKAFFLNNLTEIVIPKSVASIGYFAFGNPYHPTRKLKVTISAVLYRHEVRGFEDVFSRYATIKFINHAGEEHDK